LILSGTFLHMPSLSINLCLFLPIISIQFPNLLIIQALINDLIVLVFRLPLLQAHRHVGLSIKQHIAIVYVVVGVHRYHLPILLCFLPSTVYLFRILFTAAIRQIRSIFLVDADIDWDN